MSKIGVLLGESGARWRIRIGTGAQMCRGKAQEKSLCLELFLERHVPGIMGRFTNTLLLLLLAGHLALGGGVCACSATDDHHDQNTTAEQHLASHASSQQPSGAVTASLVHSHDGDCGCDHAAPGTEKLSAVAERGGYQVTAVTTQSLGVYTPWPVQGDDDALLIARDADCQHHWLISLRSIVLLL